MKQLLKSFLCASLLFVVVGSVKADSCCNTTSTATDCCDCTCSSIFIPRSAGDNLRRQAVYRNFRADSDFNDDCCMGNSVFGLDYEFQRSRKDDDIARSLFGSNVLLFQGSDITATSTVVRNPLALLADNFGLPSNTNAQIGFCPRVSNSIIDLEYYTEFEGWCDGRFFLQFNLPIVKSKFRLNAFDGTGLTVASTACNNSCANSCDNGCSTGCNSNCGQVALPSPTGTATPADFCPGFVGAALTLDGTATVLNPIAAAGSFEAALGGNFLFGNMQTPWNAGRFNLGCQAEDTKLASFNFILGYNGWECDDYNLGIYLRAAAPTGTDLSCCNLCCDNNGVFPVQIGDNHWKLGGGLTGRYDFYNCDDDHFVTIYAEGYAEHMFKRCQVRSFDFTGRGCLSRYMLLREFDAAGTAATGNLINAINYTTRNVQTSVNVQGEGQIELGYRNNCGFSAGLGWNIYGKSGEKACTIGSACDPSLVGRNFAINGCAQLENICVSVIGTGTTGTTATVVTPLAITTTISNATSSSATSRSCGAIDTAANVSLALPALGVTAAICVDPCTTGFVLPVAGDLVTAFSVVTTPGVVTIGGLVDTLAVTSTTPVLLDPAVDLDINSGLAHSQITNKVFGHIDYEWSDCKHMPKVYFGGEVEFATSNRCAGMNAWAIFLGGTLDF